MKRYGSRYPRSGVHLCPFGRDQAELITFLAQCEGIDAQTVVDWGDGRWRGFLK